MGYKFFLVLVLPLFFLLVLKAQENNITNLLQGPWFEASEENASFSFEGNSVIYTENQSLDISFSVVEDTICYFFEYEIEKCLILKLSPDTLVLKCGGSETIYLRK